MLELINEQYAQKPIKQSVEVTEKIETNEKDNLSDVSNDNKNPSKEILKKLVSKNKIKVLRKTKNKIN